MWTFQACSVFLQDHKWSLMGHKIAHGSQSIVYTLKQVPNSMSSWKVAKLVMVLQIIWSMEHEIFLSTLTFMTWQDFKISIMNFWIWWFIVCITFLYFLYFLSWQCQHSLDWEESKEGFLGLNQRQYQMFNGSLSLCEWKVLGFISIVGLIMRTFHTHILWVSLYCRCWACLVHLLAYKWVKTYWGIPFET
jgi:hypothetical protein